jgi:hypothetical protein
MTNGLQEEGLPAGYQQSGAESFQMLSLKRPNSFSVAVSCTLCIAICLGVVLYLVQKPIVVHGSIGQYLSQQGTTIKSDNTIIDIDNGLFISGSDVFGFPKKSGITKTRVGNRDVEIVIDPMFTELKNVSGFGTIAIRWDTPEWNNVVHISDNNQTDYLTSTEGITRSNVTISEDKNCIGWLEFSVEKSSDRISFMNRETRKTINIEKSYSIHRKPLCTNSYFYWIRESIEEGGERSVSVVRMSANRREEEIIETSIFPNVITDYEVSENDTIAIIRKNYDQQRSELIVETNNKAQSLYFEDDSYMQHLVSLGSHDRCPASALLRQTG